MNTSTQNTGNEPTLREVLDVVKLIYKDTQSLTKRVSALEKGQDKLEKGQDKLEKSFARLEDKQDVLSEKLDQVYDERKTVVHKFGMPWAMASVVMSISSVGIAKVLFF